MFGRSSLKRLTIGALLLIMVLVMGTSGYYMLGQGRFKPLQCLYMTIITISTVGYSEVLPISGDPSMMAFTVGLIVTGMGTLMYFVTAFAAFVIEGELTDLLRRKRMQQIMNKLNGHVIVCGAGRTGSYAAKRLAEDGYKVVLIDKEESLIKDFHQPRKGQILPMAGDATQEQLLEDAGIVNATGLIAALSNDQDNLYLTLTARQMNPKIRVIAKAAAQEAVKKLSRVGADRVISPALIGGYRMSLEVTAPEVSDFLDSLLYQSTSGLSMGEMRIKNGSNLVGTTLRDAHLRSRQILVLGLKEPDTGKFIYAPDSSTMLKENMVLIVLGEASEIRKDT